MKRSSFARIVLAGLLMAFLIGDSAALVLPAEAGAGPFNALVGLFRVISAINRRNRVYYAARDTQSDFNAYYASLTDTARDQLLSGDLQSLRRGENGLEPSRAAAYIRLAAALQAEQAAVTQAIEAEKNQARREFNRTLVRQLQDIIVKLPGAQRVLGDVRAVISQIRSTVIAIQAAAAAGQPIDSLTQRLAEQVNYSSQLQAGVRSLGSVVGSDLDSRLGGALNQLNQSIDEIKDQAGQAVNLLNTMDAQVSQLDLSQSEPVPHETRVGPVRIHLADRATAVIDVTSQALAFLSAAQGTGGITRQQLYQQIRADLLSRHNAQLMNAIQRVSLIDCRAVGWSDYQQAMSALGEQAAEAPDHEGAGTFMVCYDKETGEPIYGWPLRVTATGTAPAMAATTRPEASRAPRADAVFTLDDCRCGFPLAFAQEDSSASNGPSSYTTAAGNHFESMQRLDCEWSEPYSSALVTSTKWFDLNIYALPTTADGELLFSEVKGEASSHLPYCEEDHTCTPELYDDSATRHFHIEKTIFESGGEHLPSSHYAYLAELLTSPEGEAFVIEIAGYLPERDPGDTQAADLSLALERCAIDLIGQ
jgi:hypothetical protein